MENLHKEIVNSMVNSTKLTYSSDLLLKHIAISAQVIVNKLDELGLTQNVEDKLPELKISSIYALTQNVRLFETVLRWLTVFYDGHTPILYFEFDVNIEDKIATGTMTLMPESIRTEYPIEEHITWTS